jgi:hypothetical protein
MQNLRQYAHSGKQQSEFINYRGQTGQIDVEATVIKILSNRPGLRAVDVANLIYSKKELPMSHSYVYKVINRLADKDVLLKSSDGFIYMVADAVQHDMDKTISLTLPMVENNGDMETVNFALGGIVMLAEDMREWVNDREFNPMDSEAMTAITLDEDDTDDDYESAFLASDNDDYDDSFEY